MITFGLNYDVKKEHVEEFENYTKDVLGAMQGMEGHVETKLFQDVSKPNSYLIYSHWDSQETFKAFISSDAFKSAQNFGRDILEGPPKHNVYSHLKMGR